MLVPHQGRPVAGICIWGEYPIIGNKAMFDRNFFGLSRGITISRYIIHRRGEPDRFSSRRPVFQREADARRLKARTNQPRRTMTIVTRGAYWSQAE